MVSKDINQQQDGSQYRLSGNKLAYKAFVHSKKKQTTGYKIKVATKSTIHLLGGRMLEYLYHFIIMFMYNL